MKAAHLVRAVCVLAAFATVSALHARYHAHVTPRNGGQWPDCSSTAPLGKSKICNPDLSWEVRVADLLTHMNTSEKILRLATSSNSLDRLGIPSTEWWSEALHGVADSPGVHFDQGPIKAATSFPEPIGIASAFDRQLVHDVAATISTEARAMNNQGQAGISFFTPNINLFRDPRWGRGQETPGEDPYLASEYVYQLINGLQKGEDERYLKMIADCKHYAAYDLEDWHGVDRHHFNAVVSDQDMVESFLPAFESCIRDAQVASIMCSYNAVNGIPSCANTGLLTEVARGDFNLRGFVVSDCGAIDDIHETHNYTATAPEAVADAIKAGADMDCMGNYMTGNAQAALDQGLMVEADLDAALTHTLGTLIRTGYFDPPEIQPYRQYGPELVNTEAAQALALTAAQRGIALIKNIEKDDEATGKVGSGLPWSNQRDAPMNVALIGPLGNNTVVLQGNYYGRAPYLISVQQAMQDAGFNVTYIPGCDVMKPGEEGFPAALAAAAAADAVLYVGGIDGDVEREGLDRNEITLPGSQGALLAALSAELQGKKTLVAAFFGGGPIDLTAVRDDPNVQAIWWLGYPGQSGGQAFANLVTGKAAPAGRLVTTVYPAAYVNQTSLFDMTFRPSASNPGRTYRFYPAEQAVFEFGTGLSYTSWKYSWITEGMEDDPASAADESSEVASAPLPEHLQGLPIQRLSIHTLHAAHRANRKALATAQSYRVNVTNIGAVTSDIVVLLFLSPATPSPQQPLKQLIGFERAVNLSSMEVQQLHFGVQARQLALVDAHGHKWLRPGHYVLGLDVPTKPHAVIELTGLAMRLDKN